LSVHHGLTLVSWQSGQSLANPLAESYISGAAHQAAAEVATSRKDEKYAVLNRRYLLEPLAVETLSVLSSSANGLLKEICKKIFLTPGSLWEPVSFTNAF